jgi:ERCC4-type nuclease|tara:strand:+ start:3378 stop:4061 length:684 start_codon:yes stop_codon:yes gene_type:complete
MFAVKGKYLWWDDELLGNASALYLDPHEANYLTEKDGVVHKTLPNRVDGLMVDDSGDVVVIESKKPEDLRNSQKNRRLARQIKTALQMSSKVLLLIRPVWSLYTLDGKPNYSLFVDIARLQRLGVFVLPAPDNKHLAEWLWHYKKVIGEETNSTLRVLAGEDAIIDKKEEWYLVKAIKGMGPVQLAKAKMAFESPFDFFVVNDAELAGVGMNKKVIEERRKALSGNA